VAKNNSHPYHYSKDKNFLDYLMDYGVPIGLFLLFFVFYNSSQFTPREMIKNTGVLAISLLALTLGVGPLSRLIPSLDFLKAYRKVWGILSFVAALLHMILVYIVFFKYDLNRFIDFGNPRYPNIASGLVALGILMVVTLTSNQKAINSMSPNTWKAIQTTSYLALASALLHFYLLSQKDGNLDIANPLVQISFWFSLVVLVLRILILFLPSKKS
jgi:DMSO/TMAO reductase YedYZ heme-binding membrane subunit